MVRWTDIDESPYPWEQAALQYLKENLPSREPYRAWGPFDFRTSDGGLAEVDCVVVAPHAIFVIEIKSWRGDLTGGERKWFLPTRTEDNPFRKTDWKAVQLKSKLAGTKAMRAALKGRPMPRVEALVFFSEEEFTCRLADEHRLRLTGIDHSKRPGCRQGGGLPGVVESIEAFQSKGTTINKDLSSAIAEGMSELDLEPSGRFAKVGRFVIETDTLLADDDTGIEYAAHADTQNKMGTCRIAFRKAVNRGGSSSMLAAERAVLREFRMLFPQETNHQGIVKVEEIDLSHPWGPAVVYQISASARNLESFLDAEKASLTREDRMGIVRRLLDALRHAHSRHLVHRDLRPEVVYIARSPDGYWQPVVAGWHSGLRTEEDDEPVAGTVHIPRSERADGNFRAPEADVAVNAEPKKLDSFAAGALGYLILTGNRPPDDLLATLVGDERGDLVDEHLDALGDVAVVIEEAMRPDPDERASLPELVDYLAEAEEGGPPESPPTSNAASPVEVPQAPARALIPEEVSAGDSIGDFKVTRRLGAGSAAIAFLGTDASGREAVMKVAVDKSKNEAISAEGVALAKLRSRSIVQLLSGPTDVSGYKTITLQHADRGTLRDVLDKSEAIALKTILDWGRQLLGATEELEAAGVVHRDIKPENVGLVSGPDGDRPLIFDFSLASAPLNTADLGTAPYADPFAGRGDRPDYDHAADRYSLAAVLHELLTGRVPLWGEGRANPAHVASIELDLDPESLPPEAAPQLIAFFTRAMSRSSEERFASSREMAASWEACAAVAFDSSGSPSDGDQDGPKPGEPPDPALHTEILKELVLNASGGRFLRFVFRKARSRVSPEEQAAVEQMLADIPAEDRLFERSRKRWRVEPSELSISAIRALASSGALTVKPAARELIEREASTTVSMPPAEPGSPEPIDIGDFRIILPSRRERIQATTIAGDQEVEGSRLTYSVEGPEGMELEICDTSFDDGSRHVELTEASDASHWVAKLPSRRRMEVQPAPSGLRMSLRVAGPDPQGPAGLPKLANCTPEGLSELAGVDAERLLHAFGASRLGTKEELLGKSETPDPRKNDLTVIFPNEAELVPVIAYVVTRVLPLHRASADS